MPKPHAKKARRDGLAPKRHAKPGAPPGSLIPPPGAEGTSLRLYAFGKDEFFEHAQASLDQVAMAVGPDRVVWVDVAGLGSQALIEELGRLFKLHPLALEDVLNVSQRPKIEVYDDHVFCVIRKAEFQGSLKTEQLSLFWGHGFVVTLEERRDTSLDPIRERLRKAGARIRVLGADFLAYSIIDVAVDHYYPVFEALSDRLEELEDRILADPREELVHQISDIRKDLLVMKKSVWPMREALDRLGDEEDLVPVSEATRPYLRDCYSHVVQLMDVYEACREASVQLMESYHSRVAVQANDVIKVLTVIATLFMPLTFIAGVYGMNFNPAASDLNMPELNWYFGYPFALTLMLGTTSAMLLYFRRKGWLGQRGRAKRADGDVAPSP